jgi:hypothetical protein
VRRRRPPSPSMHIQVPITALGPAAQRVLRPYPRAVAVQVLVRFAWTDPNSFGMGQVCTTWYVSPPWLQLSVALVAARHVLGEHWQCPPDACCHTNGC